jgi:hypothetical protein
MRFLSDYVAGVRIQMQISEKFCISGKVIVANDFSALIKRVWLFEDDFSASILFLIKCMKKLIHAFDMPRYGSPSKTQSASRTKKMPSDRRARQQCSKRSRFLL